MFGLGFFELLVIAGVLLLLFGPDELPKIIRDFGRVLNSLRDTSKQVENEVTRTFKGDE